MGRYQSCLAGRARGLAVGGPWFDGDPSQLPCGGWTPLNRPRARACVCVRERGRRAATASGERDARSKELSPSASHLLDPLALLTPGPLVCSLKGWASESSTVTEGGSEPAAASGEAIRRNGTHTAPSKATAHTTANLSPLAARSAAAWRGHLAAPSHQASARREAPEDDTSHGQTTA